MPGCLSLGINSKNMMNRERYVNIKKKKIQEKLLLSLYGSESSITIFDIGSCEGLNAIRYSELFPSSKIFAIEPRKDNIDLIKNIFVNTKQKILK